jgi:hypothetical protein
MIDPDLQYEEALFDEAVRICDASTMLDWDKDRSYIYEVARSNLAAQGYIDPAEGVCPTEDHIERGYN